MDLVAVISSGKGTWGHVARLITDASWDSIFLITNEFGKENFSCPKPFALIQIDENRGIEEIKKDIKAQLEGKLKPFNEVAVNVVSGTGKEHMALLSALLELGIGVKFIAVTKDGVKEL
jgi:hypothetical protein